jgi:molecular chaperone GrpE (heat shock protein)
MNEDMPRSFVRPVTDEADQHTLGMSSVYRLFEAFIALREKNTREHKVFEQTVTRARDALQDSFNTFAAQTQKAYQQLRQEMQGEKKISLTLLNEFLELALALNHIAASQPSLPATENNARFEPLRAWMESLKVQNRKVQAALTMHGIHPYDAVVGTPYNPALHERVGSRRVEGMDALRVAEQIQHGYASQQPDFVLRRPKVIVTD